MGAHSSILTDVGIAILAAAVLGIPAYVLRIPLLLAYIGAGVLLGPHMGLGLIKGAQNISTLSEIGLILLMFILGLEINLKKISQAGRPVLINGFTQVLGCALIALLFFAPLDLAIQGNGKYELIYLAFGCALSSTVVVIKLLSEQLELDSLTSRITVGILVIQDLWAITFLSIQPNLTGLDPILIGISLAKAAALVVGVLTTAKYALPMPFRRTGKQPELLLILAMAWCFAIAGLAGYLNLSKEMGALVAGVAVGALPYHADVAAKITSLRDFFITLFFVALGLQVGAPTQLTFTIAAIIVGAVTISRALTVFPALYWLGYGNRASLVPAINLSQVSEFALVTCSLGVAYGHIRPDILAGFTLALVVTVFTSSITIPNSHRMFKWIGPWLIKFGIRDGFVESHSHKGDSSADRDNLDGADKDLPQIAFLGFYREASSILFELIQRHSKETKHLIWVVDYNPETPKRLHRFGVSYKYADLSHPESLTHLKLDRVPLLVCTIPDQQLKGTSNLKLLRALKKIAPESRVIVTAETLESAREMYETGAAYVFVPRLISGHYVADVIERIQSGNHQNMREGAVQYLKGRSEPLP